MHFKFKALIFFILILCVLNINVNAQSAVKSMPIVSHNNSTSSNSFVNVHFIGFWELPLWIKISYISVAILSTLIILKAVPFIIGKYTDILDNTLRNSIFNFIKGNPGETVSEISKERSVNRGTLNYHLNILLKNRKIILIKKGKLIHVFDTHSPSLKEKDIWFYLNNETERKILYSLMDTPGIANIELSALFNLNKSTIHRLLEKYEREGIIRSNKDGKYKRCYLTNEASEALKKYLGK